MNKSAWTSPEVARIIGVAPRMVTIWAERGYIAPSVVDANGRGTKRLWSRADIIHAMILRDLVDVLRPGILRRFRSVDRNFKQGKCGYMGSWDVYIGRHRINININAIQAEVDAAIG